MPYPKAPPRKVNNKGRKPGRTRILTDTPEKIELNLSKGGKTVKCKLAGQPKKKKIIPKKKQRRQVIETSSDDDDDVDLCDDNSDSDPWDIEAVNQLDFNIDSIVPGDFVLVKFATKTNVIHYVGRLDSVEEQECEVNFLRQKGRGFVFPNVIDVSSVKKSDIVLKLPPPSKSGGSDRIFSMYFFDVDLKSFSKLR